MSLARELYERFRHLIHEMAKFGIIGFVGFVITFAGTGILDKKAGLDFVAASTIATIVATFASFVGNRYWTFRHRERTGMTRETVLFFVLNGVGLIIQEGCILFSKDVLGLRGTIADYTALVIGVMIATVFRFWSYRKWVWRNALVAGLAAAPGAGPLPASPPPAEHRPAEHRPAGHGPAGHGPPEQHKVQREELEPATVPPVPFPYGPASGPVSDAARRSR